MRQTIYFGTHRLILTNKPPGDALQSHYPGAFYRRYNSGQDLADALAQVRAGASTVVLEHPDLQFLLEQVKQHFRFIQAAGGLVQGPAQKVLLIFRQGKWDLPKGHLDDGEDLPGCAVREVKEETGLRIATINQALGTTYHTYFRDGIQWLKESHWYLMETPEQGDLVPQQEEDIEQCLWVPAKNLDAYMNNTHPSIRDVVEQAKPMLG